MGICCSKLAKEDEEIQNLMFNFEKELGKDFANIHGKGGGPMSAPSNWVEEELSPSLKVDRASNMNNTQRPLPLPKASPLESAGLQGKRKKGKANVRIKFLPGGEKGKMMADWVKSDDEGKQKKGKANVKIKFLPGGEKEKVVADWLQSDDEGKQKKGKANVKIKFLPGGEKGKVVADWLQSDGEGKQKKGKAKFKIKLLPGGVKARMAAEWLNIKAEDPNLASRNYEFVEGDFQELFMLGIGRFGRVSLAQYKRADKPEDPKLVALKAVSKFAVDKHRQLAHLHDERKLLLKLKHPFIVKLWGTFQDQDHVYFVTEAIAGGDLWSVLYGSGQRGDGLPVEHTRFYAATVIEALSFMHSKGVAYRDLKPENIMIDDVGYTRVIDFGFAKKIPFTKQTKDGFMEVYYKSTTLCGTPEYIAPEFILNKGHDKSADYWAFGVLVFELMAGHTPFVPPAEGDFSITELFSNIVTSKCQGIPFPDDFNAKAKGQDAQDLIVKLLQSKPRHRLGNLAGCANDIKDHPFFKRTIDFGLLYEKKIQSPWIPTAHFPQSEEADEQRDSLMYFGKQELFDGF